MNSGFRAPPPSPPSHAPHQSAGFAATAPRSREPSPAGSLFHQTQSERPQRDGVGRTVEPPSTFLSNMAGSRPPVPTRSTQQSHFGNRKHPGARGVRHKTPPAMANRNVAFTPDVQPSVHPAIRWPTWYPTFGNDVVRALEKDDVSAVTSPMSHAGRGVWLPTARTITSAPVKKVTPASQQMIIQPALSTGTPRNTQWWLLGETHPPPRHEVPPSSEPPARQGALGAWGPSRGGAPRMREQPPTLPPNVVSAPRVKSFSAGDRCAPCNQEDPSRPLHGYDSLTYRYYHAPDPYADVSTRAANKINYDKYPTRNIQKPSDREVTHQRIVPLTARELDPIPYYQAPSPQSKSAALKESDPSTCTIERKRQEKRNQPIAKCKKSSVNRPHEFTETEEMVRRREIKEAEGRNKCCKKEWIPVKISPIVRKVELPPPPYKTVVEQKRDVGPPKEHVKTSLSRIYDRQFAAKKSKENSIPSNTRSSLHPFRSERGTYGGVGSVSNWQKRGQSYLSHEPDFRRSWYNTRPSAGPPMVGKGSQGAGMLPDGTLILPPESDRYSKNKVLLAMQGIRGYKSGKESKCNLPRLEPPTRYMLPSLENYGRKTMVPSTRFPSTVGGNFTNPLYPSRNSFLKRNSMRRSLRPFGYDGRQSYGERKATDYRPQQSFNQYSGTGTQRGSSLRNQRPFGSADIHSGRQYATPKESRTSSLFKSENREKGIEAPRPPPKYSIFHEPF